MPTKVSGLAYATEQEPIVMGKPAPGFFQIALDAFAATSITSNSQSEGVFVT